MHSGEMMIVDRKTGQQLLIVPSASVSIVGGIQPEILARALRGQLTENGLAARLLMAYPPVKQKRWTDDDVPPQQTAMLESVIDRLRTLDPRFDENGDPEPQLVGMTPHARKAFIEWYDAQAADQCELTGDIASAYSKIEEYAARLALVVHLAAWALDDSLDHFVLDESSMRSGLVNAWEWLACFRLLTPLTLTQPLKPRGKRGCVNCQRLGRNRQPKGLTNANGMRF